MREYKRVRRTTKVLTKIMCDICGKEIHKISTNNKRYLPSTVITAKRKFSSDGWCIDNFEFCSVECFLKWAKTARGAFNVYFPYDTLKKLIKADMIEELEE